MKFASMIVYVADVAASLEFYEEAFGLARGYVDESDRKYLRDGASSIKYLDYDWTLNEQQK